jgi:hypothetical protein
MKDRKRQRNIKEIIEKIKQFTTLKELITLDFGTYLYVKRNKLECLIDHLPKRMRVPIFTTDVLSNKIKEYKYNKEFRLENKSMYGFILKNKLHYLMSKLIKRNKPMEFTPKL